MMRRLLLLLLSSCVLGGHTTFSSAETQTVNETLSGRVCAFVGGDVALVGSAAGPISVALRVGAELRELPVRTTEEGTVVVTVPSELAPGYYPLRVTRSADARNEGALSVDASSEDCAALFHPHLTAHGGFGTVTLSWTSALAATRYKWRRGSQTGIVAGTGLVDGPLGAGETLTYVVTALTPLGEFQSNSAVVTTIPATPVRLVANRDSLDWDPQVGASDYVVERGAGETTRLSASAPPFTDSGAKPGVACVYQVRARNESGESAPSPPIRGYGSSSRRLLVCQKSGTKSGFLSFDAASSGDTYPLSSLQFDSTQLEQVALDLLATPNGQVWMSDGRQLVSYGVAPASSQTGFSFALREMSGDTRPQNRAGRALAYDVARDEIVLAGKNPVGGAQSVLYSVPRSLLTDPKPSRQRLAGLDHDAVAIAISPAGELFVATASPTPAIVVYDLSDLDALEKGRLSGPSTRLSAPVDIAYDATHDELVVADSSQLLRFSALSRGDAPPIASTIATYASITLNDGGVLYGLSVPSGAIFQIHDAGETRIANVAGITNGQIAYEETSNTLWLSGGVSGAPFVAVLGPSGTQLVGQVTGMASEPSISGRCQSMAKGFVVAPSGPFSLSFFEQPTAPLVSSQVWDTFSLQGLPGALEFADFATNPTTDQVYVLGSRNVGSGNWRDFVAAFSRNQLGSSVVSSMAWDDPGPSAAAQTSGHLYYESGELVFWRDRNKSLTVVSASGSSSPLASGTDGAASSVLDITYSRRHSKILLLLANEVRRYDRVNLSISPHSLLVGADLVDARGFALDDASDELFISVAEGIVVFDATATGANPIKRKLLGARTHLSNPRDVLFVSP